MQNLLEYLSSLQPGAIADTGQLEKLLSASWDEFEGNCLEGMAAYKLHGRMREVVWEPPSLTFTIERHGSTVQGSSRAEVHHWSLNTNAKTATCSQGGYRQVSPMAARLDVLPLAEKVFHLIIEGCCTQELRWNKDGTVSVQIGKLLPTGSATPQTLEGRRRRFREALEKMMDRENWQCVRANVFRGQAD